MATFEGEIASREPICAGTGRLRVGGHQTP
jgi:hypothetical protein